MTASTLEAGEFIDAGGHRTHYHEAGSGETIVFIHGSGPGVTSWANWRNALPVFADRFHVLAPDLLGFGFSARPANVRYGKDVWVDHLRAFLLAVQRTRYAFSARRDSRRRMITAFNSCRRCPKNKRIFTTTSQ